MLNALVPGGNKPIYTAVGGNLPTAGKARNKTVVKNGEISRRKNGGAALTKET
jgi:hypothetical protein